MEPNAFKFIKNFSTVICCLSIPSNLYAAHVIRHAKSRLIGNYRLSFYVFILADIMYATSYVLIGPMFLCNFNTVGFVLIGPMNWLPRPFYPFFTFFHLFSFGMVYLTAINSYLCRYFHICRPRLFLIIRTYKMLFILFNLMVLIFLAISLYTFYAPNKQALDALRERSMQTYGYAIGDKYFLSLSYETMFESKSRFFSCSFIALLNLGCFLACVIITRALCRKLFGDNKIANVEYRVTQRYFFYLLLIQIAVPCTFLLAPYLMANCIVLFKMRPYMWTGSCITVVFSFYPFINSFTYLYVKDYKKYIYNRVAQSVS